MNTAWEKFHGATLSLVRSGPIKDRLVAAYRDHLADVTEDDLPREIRERFHSVRCSLTRERPLRGEDAIRATVRKMSCREADDIACTLVEMMAEFARVQPQRSSAPALYLVEA
ncbi:MAG TPA: hypothetical protein VMB48_09890 [Steroidobacteraceae bacterium]|nr:hypothetical protein [Steroidobacteraceae bacterium]